MFNIPFTYNWVLIRFIKEYKPKTILELGCGKGYFGDLINKNHKFDITGVDIFQPYLNHCKKEGRYTKLIKMNLSKKVSFKNQRFDLVVCLQTIEHLDKDQGLRLLAIMEKIAKKIIISVPVGECLQDSYDDNLHQRHLSSWNPKDFQDIGYRVHGIGLKLAYGSQSHAEEHLEIKKIPLFFLSFLTNPLAYFFPAIGCQMIAVKNKTSK